MKIQYQESNQSSGPGNFNASARKKRVILPIHRELVQGAAKMFESLSLRTKILCIFSAMALIVLCGVTSMLWYTHQNEKLLNNLISREIVLYKTAQDLELALANQKGFLTYYLVDGNVNWLRSLGEYRQVFTNSLQLAATYPLSDEQRKTLDEISRHYQTYIQIKDKAIEDYSKASPKYEISSPHAKQRDVFFNLLDLCRAFSQQQWQLIKQIENDGRKRAHKTKIVALTGIAAFTALSVIFLVFLYRQVLLPIRGLALRTGSSEKETMHDEVDSLRQSLHNMIRDFDETSDELAKSRKHLVQAERMAIVGELAAGVAHTIRNPFTSIKMRMFSLSRTLDLTDIQNEDLRVISEEISRIDKIVQNFLEFARPPKLKLEHYNLSRIIDSVLALLEYRIRQYDVELRYRPLPDLPPLCMDADRIKEAIVNLIINSCEATGHGGIINISASIETLPKIGEVAAIRISDNGPGIPPAILNKICSPFFTTKEEGSGLGLSIVSRIAQEHGGIFTVDSIEGKGTRCTIYLPCKGYANELDPDN